MVQLRALSAKSEAMLKEKEKEFRAQRGRKNNSELEEDGIMLIDLQSHVGSDDLRKSLGSVSGPGEVAEVGLHEQLVLLKELERVRQERDELRRSKEQLQRDILNQTFGKCENCAFLTVI